MKEINNRIFRRVILFVLLFITAFSNVCYAGTSGPIFTVEKLFYDMEIFKGGAANVKLNGTWEASGKYDFITWQIGQYNYEIKNIKVSQEGSKGTIEYKLSESLKGGNVFMLDTVQDMVTIKILPKDKAASENLTISYTIEPSSSGGFPTYFQDGKGAFDWTILTNKYNMIKNLNLHARVADGIYTGITPYFSSNGSQRLKAIIGNTGEINVGSADERGITSFNLHFEFPMEVLMTPEQIALYNKNGATKNAGLPESSFWSSFKKDRNPDFKVLLIIAAVFSALLFLGYKPRMDSIKEQYSKYGKNFREHFFSMPAEEQHAFMNSLDADSRSAFESFMNNSMEMNNMFQQQVMMQQMQQFNEWAMNESMKSVTPFDYGGYVMGQGFNPSDTMHFEDQQDSMNHMNDMNNSMNDMNNMNNMNNF